MLDYTIILPSKPKIVSERDFTGVYEVDSLYPGYGHTLGNSLRRIILSSLEGTAITSVKIAGVSHEFSTIDGVKEDVIALLLNLKKINFALHTREPQVVTISAKGPKKVTAGDMVSHGQVSVLNPDQHIAEITVKNVSLTIELTLEHGFGYVSKEVLMKDKVDIGVIALDAVFSPIRRVNYEVENMRVGDRTDYNKLRFFIETNGTIMPREALESAIHIMIRQLQAIVGFQEEMSTVGELPLPSADVHIEKATEGGEDDKEFLKTKVETLGFSTRTANALDKASIRTVGGMIKKSEEDLLDLEGLGEKGVQEIKRTLGNFGLTLK